MKVKLTSTLFFRNWKVKIDPFSDLKIFAVSEILCTERLKESGLAHRTDHIKTCAMKTTF